MAAAESLAHDYMKMHAMTAEQFQVHTLPSRPTERRFLVPRSKAAIYDKIAPIIRKLKDDPAWERRAAQYE